MRRLLNLQPRRPFASRSLAPVAAMLDHLAFFDARWRKTRRIGFYPRFSAYGGYRTADG